MANFPAESRADVMLSIKHMGKCVYDQLSGSTTNKIIEGYEVREEGDISFVAMRNVLYGEESPFVHQLVLNVKARIVPVLQ